MAALTLEQGLTFDIASLEPSIISPENNTWISEPVTNPRPVFYGYDQAYAIYSRLYPIGASHFAGLLQVSKVAFFHSAYPFDHGRSQLAFLINQEGRSVGYAANLALLTGTPHDKLAVFGGDLVRVPPLGFNGISNNPTPRYGSTDIIFDDKGVLVSNGIGKMWPETHMLVIPGRHIPDRELPPYVSVLDDGRTAFAQAYNLQPIQLRDGAEPQAPYLVMVRWADYWGDMSKLTDSRRQAMARALFDL